MLIEVANFPIFFSTIVDECQYSEDEDRSFGQVRHIVVAIELGPIVIEFDPSPRSLTAYLSLHSQWLSSFGSFDTTGFVVDCTLLVSSLYFEKNFDVDFHNSD